MTFRLFGASVEIQWTFWLGALLFGYPILQSPYLPKTAIVVWAAVLLFSILAHEMGHAFAVMRHRIEPEVALHWMGGTTRWRMLLPLTRIDRIVISLAGPFAGFLVGGLIYAAEWAAPEVFRSLPLLARFAVDQLQFINIVWGLINLIPVLPFDGGHVLEHALGPKRIRMTALISGVIGVLTAMFFLFVWKSTWGALIFGLGAFQSFQRWQAEGPAVRVMPTAPRAEPERVASRLSPAAAQLLRSAKEALADEDVDRAVSLAQQILQGQAAAPGVEAEPASPAAAHAALEVIAWAHLLAGRPDEAASVLEAVRRIDTPDPALRGAVLQARGELKEARRVLEAARAAGDDRKEVVGPLIQILIEQGEVARAAAVAYDIVDALSEDDARRMASIAFERGAFSWAARLYEAIFQRRGQPEDAYEAARAHAQGGEHERALDLLRRAVEAGFSDRARAWSDAALAALRGERGMEAVLPRP